MVSLFQHSFHSLPIVRTFKISSKAPTMLITFRLFDLVHVVKMAIEITQFLPAAQSADAKIRTEAEASLRQFQEQNMPVFLLSLSVELSNDENPVESRRLAGIVFKNSLDAKDAIRKEQLLALLFLRRTSSQVIAKISSIEIPRKQWPELIGSLLNNMTQQDKPASLKQATLETLGYVCEEISHQDLVQDEVNAVLTVVVQGMNLADHGSEVRLAATKALYNALEFAQTNFENEMERNYIMKLTSNAVKGDEETVALQATEFWSSICDEEIELQEFENPESGDSGPPHSCFIEKALSSLVPLLLETLLKQEEDKDQDDTVWNISMAGGTCLGLVARTVGDAIVPLVMPFVESNIVKPDWRCREAATYAFGSILEGPTVDKLSPLLLHSPATGFSIISPENLKRVIGVLLESIKDAPNVAEKVCGAIYYLVQGYEDAGPSSSLLSPYLTDIISCLIATADRTDGASSIISHLLPVIMNKLGQTMEIQIVSSDDRQKLWLLLWAIWQMLLAPTLNLCLKTAHFMMNFLLNTSNPTTSSSKRRQSNLDRSGKIGYRSTQIQIGSFSIRIDVSSGKNSSGLKQIKTRLIQVRVDFSRISFRSGHIIDR
ncbi:L-type lectin-domain containing receptor kinase IV.2-like [Hibiscus syriacus]|uniref:L-type lectin-domain containing receptor kinase IV.2-like n=1 Tax=Hibiscus syriacus TaxID=106335 RepID=A0A6A2Z5A1_HIBSY|nr:L-type lectin-domain containing receptor kinase IV.2-like [Hibiscus syriacus]